MNSGNSSSTGEEKSTVPGSAGSERRMIVLLLAVMVISSGATLMVMYQPNADETALTMLNMMCERWGNASEAVDVLGESEGMGGGFFIRCEDPEEYTEVNKWNGSLFFVNSTRS